MSVLRASPSLRAALRWSLALEAEGALSRWLRAVRERAQPRVEVIAFADLHRWALDPARLTLAHDSGRFFSIIGVDGSLACGADSRRLAQPLISQDEVGILGLLLRVEDGCAQVLVQAKFEPGDPQPVQLAPTLQATRSNYSRVHGGRPPEALAGFLDPPASAVLVDVELPEQAEFFLAKHNRNMVVLVDDAPELVGTGRFRWATLAELGEALAQRNLVNMSLRSVLACLLALALEPAPAPAELAASVGARALADARWSWRMDRVALDRLPGWTWSARGLVADQDQDQDQARAGVCFVAVETREREVQSWTQPMLTRATVDEIALYVRAFAGRWWLLAGLSLGAGQPGGPRLGPTRGPTQPGPRSAGLALDGAALRVDVELAEDGGRLFALRHRYRVWQLADGPLACEPGWVWLPLAEVPALLGRGLLDVELRSCILAFAMRTGASPPSDG